MNDRNSRIMRAGLVLGVLCLLPGCAAEPKTVFEGAENGDGAAVRRFIADGADVNAVDALGKTPLHCAAEKGHLEVAAFLLDHGARADMATAGDSDSTPLCLAAQNGHVEVMKLLLSRGAKVNAVDRRGRTPLHFAARSEARMAVRLLVAKGAYVNAGNESGRTPLHEAVGYLNLAAAEELVRGGAAVNRKDRYGYTPLHSAVREGDADMAQFLMSKGGKIDLFLAAGTDDVTRVRAILKRRGGINDADGLGYTALHWAAQGGCVNTARLLVARGANLDAKNGYKMTPLHVALCGRGPATPDAENYLAVGRMLVLAGADVNARDAGGRTALGWADFRGYTEFAAFVASRGGRR